MNANRRDFVDEIVRSKSMSREGHSEYGSHVMPALQIYKSLASYEERRAYQDALERMLREDDAEVRNFAVDVCLGFFVFRNAI